MIINYTQLSISYKFIWYHPRFLPCATCQGYNYEQILTCLCFCGTDILVGETGTAQDNSMSLFCRRPLYCPGVCVYVCVEGIWRREDEQSPPLASDT